MSAAAEEIRRQSENEELQRKERATASAKLGPLGKNLVLRTARMRYNQQVERMLEAERGMPRAKEVTGCLRRRCS